MPEIRGGRPATEVYERSIVEARRMVSDGAPVDRAMNAGKVRAASTAQTDVIAANREAVGAGRRPWVVGYRRVLTGKSCALCATASTQRYRKAELAPIHPRCDCDVAEIYGDSDPGAIINQQLLDDLKRDGGSNYWKRNDIIVDEHGTIRRTKIEYPRDPDTGKRLLDSRGNPIRRKVPGEPVRPVAQTHGELGKVLTDRRYSFTSADDLADVELPKPAPSTATRVEVLDNAAAPDLAATNVDEIPSKIAREALEDAPAPPTISGPPPEVVDIAERYGVTPDEVLVARARVDEVRAEIRNVAAEIQQEAFDQLYQWNDVKMQGPGRFRGKPPPEYDWMKSLDQREKSRLSRKWFDSSLDAPTPDVLVAQMKSADPSLAALDFEDVIARWLDVNRRYEMAGAIRRGKLPSTRAYSGALDPDDLFAAFEQRGISVRTVLSSDDLDVAGHIAAADRVEMADEAYQYLGRATSAPTGSRPYEMSFQQWEEEVRTLEYGLRNYPGEMPPGAVDRLAELVPEFIDEPGLDFEELYARIVSTAQIAGEEVPSYARIPWKE
jgi:hypothetical protein